MKKQERRHLIRIVAAMKYLKLKKITLEEAERRLSFIKERGSNLTVII